MLRNTERELSLLKRQKATSVRVNIGARRGGAASRGGARGRGGPRGGGRGAARGARGGRGGTRDNTRGKDAVFYRWVSSLRQKYGY